MRPSATLKAVALVACAAGAAAWNPTPPLEGLNGALAEVGEAAQYVQGLAEEVQGAEALGIPESVDVEELVASLKPAKFAKKLNQYAKFALVTGRLGDDDDDDDDDDDGGKRKLLQVSAIKRKLLQIAAPLDPVAGTNSAS